MEQAGLERNTRARVARGLQERFTQPGFSGILLACPRNRQAADTIQYPGQACLCGRACNLFYAIQHNCFTAMAHVKLYSPKASHRLSAERNIGDPAGRGVAGYTWKTTPPTRAENPALTAACRRPACRCLGRRYLKNYIKCRLAQKQDNVVWYHSPSIGFRSRKKDREKTRTSI
jgi:hypothetical protein